MSQLTPLGLPTLELAKTPRTRGRAGPPHPVAPARTPRGPRSLAGAALSLLALTWVGLGCAAPPPSGPSFEELMRRGMAAYEAGDFVVAAETFASAERAGRFGRRSQQLASVRIAECTAWLRAARMTELGYCTLRLQELDGSPALRDPGVDALIAMGAIAGGRSPNTSHLPASVDRLVNRAAGEAL